MIRDLVVGMLWSAATNARATAHTWRDHVYASEVATWIYREEFGFAGAVMYRAVSEHDFSPVTRHESGHFMPQDAAEWATLLAGTGIESPSNPTKRCICPPPRRVGSWNGDVGHVFERDPRCTIHSRDTI